MSVALVRNLFESLDAALQAAKANQRLVSGVDAGSVDVGRD